MDQMTAEEKKVVEELRKRTITDVTPKMLEDVSLFYRFAKGRNFNLAEAEAMLRQHISWRKELKVDTILTDYEPPEVLVKYAPSTFLCFDKEGRVVRVQDLGRADLKGLWAIANLKEWMKFSVFEIEKDIERATGRGGNLGKPIYTSIMDFDNFTYANAISIKNMQYVTSLTKMYVDNYPETLKSVTILNVPFSFSWFFAAIRPILPSAVIQKLRLYGKDGWKETLLEKINADDLPAYLGGNKTDPDGNPLCETFITRGQPIPKTYYIQNKEKKLSLEPDAQKVTVLPFSKQEIVFAVEEENSYLEWEFETKNGDINFSLLFIQRSPEVCETMELIPLQRIDTSDEPENGYFKCEKIGNYTIVFDNSYSWIHSKEVYYRAGITNAKNKNVTSLYDAN